MKTPRVQHRSHRAIPKNRRTFESILPTAAAALAFLRSSGSLWSPTLYPYLGHCIRRGQISTHPPFARHRFVMFCRRASVAHSRGPLLCSPESVTAKIRSPFYPARSAPSSSAGLLIAIVTLGLTSVRPLVITIFLSTNFAGVAPFRPSRLDTTAPWSASRPMEFRGPCRCSTRKQTSATASSIPTRRSCSHLWVFCG